MIETGRAGRVSGLPAGHHAALRGLELTVLQRLDGILQGDYRGLLPGHGTESGEARVYEPGDDVRRIDWNVTARLVDPHVRETIADRELETLIVADLSGSMSFGTALTEKRDLAVSAAAAVGFLVARGGNRIGALLLRGDEHVWVPPRSGRASLQALLFGLLEQPRDGASIDLERGLREAGRVARRRGLVVVVSDFLDHSAWRRPLAALTRRHDVLCVEVLDPRELTLPDVGTLPVVDPETSRRRWVDTRSSALRERYAAAAAEQRGEIRRAILASGGHHLQLRTDRDWVTDLVHFIVIRRRGYQTGRRP